MKHLQDEENKLKNRTNLLSGRIFGNKIVVELEKLTTAFFIYENEDIKGVNEIAKRLFLRFYGNDLPAGKYNSSVFR